jgi:hypothetical protein
MEVPTMTEMEARSDLVERLRDYSLFERGDDMDIWRNCCEAADEIERLRAALQAITDLCKTSPANPFLADDMDRIAYAALNIQQREHDPNIAPCDDAEFGMKP